MFVSATALSPWDAALMALSCHVFTCPCGCRPVKNNFILRTSKMKTLCLFCCPIQRFLTSFLPFAWGFEVVPDGSFLGDAVPAFWN